MPLACWDYSIEETRATRYFQSHGRDGSPSWLARHAKWINVVDVWARSPLKVCGGVVRLGWQKGQDA
jgi:hypothetical protein